MTIDTSGKWWKGSTPDDLDEYLRTLAPQEIGYSLEAFRLALCSCGSNTFALRADRDEGGAERTCNAARHVACFPVLVIGRLTTPLHFIFSSGPDRFMWAAVSTPKFSEEKCPASA
jgi:hypothetical protein